MTLDDPISVLTRVGETYQKRLRKLNLATLYDLINHFPSRYLDYSQTSPIAKLQPDQDICIKATLKTITSLRLPSHKTLQKAVVYDSSGTLEITWFNQPYLKNVLKTGQHYYFTGTLNSHRQRPIFNSPEFEPVRDQQLHANRIVPLYPLTSGISHKWLRHKIHHTLASIKIPEILPGKLEHLLSLNLESAYRQIHFPDSYAILNLAQTRLSLNDLTAIYLKSGLTRQLWRQHAAPSININTSAHRRLLTALDFSLTPDQNKAITTIFSDIKKSSPMNRLLQGDVGSGKTVVALAAALQVIHNQFSVLILAPTQVLAEQHFHTFSRLLTPFSIKPLLVTGRSPKKLTPAPITIGTHALLHRAKLINQQRLGLLIIDEQHRFGVVQRSHFLNSPRIPHLLTMSATPIPRTIALSLYGHLQISNIKTMPKNRLPVKTWVVPENKRQNAYQWILKQITKHHAQAFFICPFIEESQSGTLKSIKAVTTEYKHLQNRFPDLKISLLHGKMKPDEKNRILQNFKSKKCQILVSTSVIEVGIDIPNANIMLIEGSQRFGLAQLHQLRGRVGRGERQSYCLLFSSDESRSSLHRLKLMERHQQGLTLAKLDLRIRGAGDIFGTAQSGHIDTQFTQFWDNKIRLLAKKITKDILTFPWSDSQKILAALNPNLAKNTTPN